MEGFLAPKWFVEQDGEYVASFDNEASAERYATLLGLDAVVVPADENFLTYELESDALLAEIDPEDPEWLEKMLAWVSSSAYDNHTDGE